MTLRRFALTAALLLTPSAVVWPAEIAPLSSVSPAPHKPAEHRERQWRPRHQQITELGISLRVSSRPPEQPRLRLRPLPMQPKPATETVCRLVLNPPIRHGETSYERP